MKKMSLDLCRFYRKVYQEASKQGAYDYMVEVNLRMWEFDHIVKEDIYGGDRNQFEGSVDE